MVFHQKIGLVICIKCTHIIYFYRFWSDEIFNGYSDFHLTIRENLLGKWHYSPITIKFQLHTKNIRWKNNFFPFSVDSIPATHNLIMFQYLFGTISEAFILHIMHNQIYLVLKKKKNDKTIYTEALLPWRNDVRKWSLIINTTNKMRMTSMQLNPVFVFVRVQLDYLPFLRYFHFYARLNVLSWNPLNADKIRALNPCNETFVSLFLSKQRDSTFFSFKVQKWWLRLLCKKKYFKLMIPYECMAWYGIERMDF